ncbi:MAG: hypothetical protein M3Z50_03235 [Actinomycetota bacterium]|nr:hypothetical protein [Actinomycetota bacterium]
MTVIDPRLEKARTIADAVLYEGYLLYPYRASSDKNRSRWQFGVLGPPGAADRGLGEAESMTLHTVLVDVSESSSLTMHLRFLQLQHRQVEDAEGAPVDQLAMGERVELTWDEAVEAELTVTVRGLAGDRVQLEPEGDLRVPGGEDAEPMTDANGRTLGRVIRQRWALTAQVTAETEQHGRFARLTLRVSNAHADRPATKEEATRTSLLGAHLIVVAKGCSFVSMIDPPPDARHIVDACRQDRCWPFLAGDEGETDLLLGSPIILYDHPELAPESAGALFDATEIDEILTLRVMTMTDAEKAEARATDPRAKEIIDRCDAMTPGDLQQLHGIFRDPRGPLGAPAEPDFPMFSEVGGPVPDQWSGHTIGEPGDQPGEQPWWDPAMDSSVDPATDSVVVDGVKISRGSLVTVRPKRRADAQDLFFADQIARVTAVLADVDGGTHIALVLADDPAADLHDWYGRYLYFTPDEIEPLDNARKESTS